MYRNGIKRLLAVILSLCGMIVLSPLLLILCIAIKVDSPGPILFKQKRVGIHKQHFNILKFRTMRTDTPKDVPTHMLAQQNIQYSFQKPLVHSATCPDLFTVFLYSAAFPPHLYIISHKSCYYIIAQVQCQRKSVHAQKAHERFQILCRSSAQSGAVDIIYLPIPNRWFK